MEDLEQDAQIEFGLLARVSKNNDEGGTDDDERDADDVSVRPLLVVHEGCSNDVDDKGDGTEGTED